MEATARIRDDWIEIDTDAWIEARTGGKLDELTETFAVFDEAVSQATVLRLDTVTLFAAARAGHAWRDAEPHVIDTSGGGGGPVGLSQDIVVHRYPDPEHGPAALIATTNGHHRDQPVAYADTTSEGADWLDYTTVELYCPAGHEWTYNSRDLTNNDGTWTTDQLFPNGMIQPARSAGGADGAQALATAGASGRILCPTCGQPCKLDITPA